MRQPCYGSFVALALLLATIRNLLRPHGLHGLALELSRAPNDARRDSELWEHGTPGIFSKSGLEQVGQNQPITNGPFEMIELTPSGRGL